MSKLDKSILLDYLKLKYDEKLTWKQVCDLIYEGHNVIYSVGEISKWATMLKDEINKPVNEDYKQMEMNLDSEKDDEMTPTPMELKILELKKAKVRLSDERIQNNANVRLLARIDSLKEIAEEAADKVASAKPFNVVNKNIVLKSKYVMTVCLSDWHYGIDVDNPFNKYNPDIAKERLNRFVNEVIAMANTYQPKEINIVNLGDLISGRIHSTIRLNNRIDAVTQTIEVAELLAEFINNVYSNTEAVVNYYDAIDNHSRVEPNLKESLAAESLVRIIHWFIKQRFVGMDDLGLHINDNDLGPEFVTFKIHNFNVIGVHGHNDKMGSVVKNLTLMTRDQYDLVLTAHMHHPAMEEENKCVVVQNGSLMGVDDYSSNLRCSSFPSQNVIISTTDNPVYAIHTIRV